MTSTRTAPTDSETFAKVYAEALAEHRDAAAAWLHERAAELPGGMAEAEQVHADQVVWLNLLRQQAQHWQQRADAEA